MDDAAYVTERIADLLDAHKVEIPTEAYKAIEGLLDDWETEVREDAREEGKSEGYDEALETERIVDDKTMQDLETGLDLVARGDPCASAYLGRALRDLGSDYINGAML